jgi:hypothetical protein
MSIVSFMHTPHLIDTGLLFYTVAFLLASVIGIAMGFLVQFLARRKRRTIAEVIWIFIGINLICGCTYNMAYIDNCPWLPGDNHTGGYDCEAKDEMIEFVDASNGIKCESFYLLDTGDREGFVYFTNNGGRNWRQFAFLHFRGGGQPACNPGNFDDNFLWMILSGDVFIYTHDGGDNWQLWGVDEQYGNFSIREVEFISVDNGTMKISTSGSTSETFYLQTTDGGETWQRFEND